MATEKFRRTLIFSDEMTEFLAQQEGKHWDKVASQEAYKWLGLGFDLAVANFPFEVAGLDKKESVAASWWDERRVIIAGIAALNEDEFKPLEKHLRKHLPTSKD